MDTFEAIAMADLVITVNLTDWTFKVVKNRHHEDRTSHVHSLEYLMMYIERDRISKLQRELDEKCPHQ